MAKGQTTVSDFAVAPRRSRTGDPAAKRDDAPLSLERPSEEARRERSVSKALQREESRVRLRDLKRARDRESKHYVNCPLNYETKKRLERASFENDVKMTKIMQAAIDQYLKDNGY